MKEYSLKTAQYNKLAFFARKKNDSGLFKVFEKSKECAIYTKQFLYNDFEYQIVNLEENKHYTIILDDIEITISYLYCETDVLKDGVCFIEFEDSIEYYHKDNLHEFYTQQFRNQYHFTPFKNWMNDPNGLCFYKNKFHMFYQQNPHAPAWNNMHWGHAVSEDLINWVHLPTALFPQKELFCSSSNKGGAFSGSAVIHKDVMRIFLTRDFSSMGDYNNIVETQSSACCYDGINVVEEKTIIGKRPTENTSVNFRDPKVLKIDDKWYLVLGSAVDDIPSILLYSSENLEDWEYEGILLSEEEIDCIAIECPDIFKLEDKYVITASLMNSTDSMGRKNLMRYYIGDLKDGKFLIEDKDILDFGTNCYAQQSFLHQGRVISFGWICDFYGEYIHEYNSSNGSLTLPREFILENDKLRIRPAAEVKKLRNKLLYKSQGSNFVFDRHADNRLEIDIDFNDKTDMELLISSNKERSIRIVYTGNELEIISDSPVIGGRRFPAAVEKLESLEIYVDRSVLEVYINKGESVGTKLFYIENPEYKIQAEFSNPHSVELAEIYEMSSVW